MRLCEAFVLGTAGGALKSVHVQLSDEHHIIVSNYKKKIVY